MNKIKENPLPYLLGLAGILFGWHIYSTYKKSAYKKCQDRNAAMQSGGVPEDCTKFSAILEN